MHEGRQEVILLAPLRWYDDRGEDGWVRWEEGHNDGWDAGREEGYPEVRTVGFEEGHEMNSWPWWPLTSRWPWLSRWRQYRCGWMGSDLKRF